MEEHGLRIPAPPSFVSPRGRMTKFHVNPKEVLPPLHLGRSPRYSPKREVRTEHSPPRQASSPRLLPKASSSPRLLPKSSPESRPQRGNVGFEAVSAAMHKLIESLGGEDSLDDKWLQVSIYLDNYASDAERTTYASNLSDVFERSDLSPNPTATVACLDRVFLLLSLYMPSVASLVATLRTRLSALLFANPPSCSVKPLPFEIDASSAGELHHSLTEGEPGTTYKDALNAIKIQDEEADMKKATEESRQRGLRREGVNKLMDKIEKRHAASVLRLWRAGMRNRKMIRSLERQLEAREQLKNSLERKLNETQNVNRKLKDEIKVLNKTIEDAALADERSIAMSVSLKVEKDELTEYQEKLLSQNNLLRRQLKDAKEVHDTLIAGKNKTITQQSTSLAELLVLLRGDERGIAVCDEVAKYVENYSPSPALCDTRSLAKFVIQWMQGIYAQAHNISIKPSRGDFFFNATRELKYMYTALMHVAPAADRDIDVEDENVDLASELFTFCEVANVNTCSITAEQLLSNANSRLYLSLHILLRGLELEKNQSDTGHIVLDWSKEMNRTEDVLKQRGNAQGIMDQLMNKAFVTSQFFNDQEGILSMEEQKDKRRFSFTDNRLQDLFTATGEEHSGGLRAVNDVLGDNYKRLRNIYRYYSSVDSAMDVSLTRSELSQFLKDCKCSDVDRNVKKSKKGSDIFRDVNMKDKGELSAEEWIQVIVRTASAKAKGATLAYKLSTFLSSSVIPNANYVAVDEFKTELKKEHIQNVLQENKVFLQRVYGYYSSLEADSSKRELSWKEFKRLMDDIKAVDEVCTHYAIMQIFIKLQSDTASVTVEDLGMSYAEFVVGVAAVAAFKNPAPYLPLHNKIRRFIQVWMVPALVKRIKVDS